ncbi:hypothetical protein [uncultured Oscillibacter sp.]|uniref:hypothetical protein n=1 Tax=uncultured Oscillibacter sp. TaxID=876091 RepID=UPI0025D20F87|nr:hypothetical protein [uncultured Oscillibacter sp.]
MSSGSKYTWQEIAVSPDNVSEILDQMEFLEKILDCDPYGAVIDLEEQQAIHKELSRLCSLIPEAFDTEMRQQLEAAAKRSSQHAGSPQMTFRQTSYEFRGSIWLTVFGLLFALMISFMMPFTDRDLPWMFPLLFTMLFLDLAWAIWACTPKKG